MSEDHPKIEIKEVLIAVKDLRESVKQQGKDSAEFKEKAEKINTFLDKQEDEKQKYIKAIEKKEEEAKVLNERLETLELNLAKGGEAKKDFKEGLDYKAIDNFAKRGMSSLSPEEVKSIQENKVMRMDDNTTGGALTSIEMETSIIKSITEISNVRSVSRVKSINKKTLEIPVRKSILTARFEGEAGEGPTSQSAYGTEMLTAFRQTVTVEYTVDQLNDSNFDLLTEINGDVVEAFAQGEGNRHILGSGVKEPEGLIINPTLITNAFSSAVSGVVDATDLTLVTGQLKVGYNPMYAFNRGSLATFRTLEDSAGRPIWQIGLAAAAPNQINGERYVIFQDLPNITNSSLSVLYGDFKRGYLVVDRTGMVIIRDEFTSASEAIIKLTFRRYTTGKVVLPEAIKILKTLA